HLPPAPHCTRARQNAGLLRPQSAPVSLPSVDAAFRPASFASVSPDCSLFLPWPNSSQVLDLRSRNDTAGAKHFTMAFPKAFRYFLHPEYFLVLTIGQADGEPRQLGL